VRDENGKWTCEPEPEIISVNRTCETGEYYNFTTEGCEDCIENCEVCQADGYCEQCEEGYEYISNSTGKQCVDKCEENEYRDGNGTCV